MKNWDLDWPAFMIGAGCLVIGIMLGCETSIKLRKDAVKAGAAHWVITDTNTGATEFQWITNK